MLGLKENIVSSFFLFENSLNGDRNTHFHKLRLKAFNHFRDKGFPGKKHEDWRYTDLRPLLKHDYVLESKQQKDIGLSDVKKYFLQGVDSYKLVFVDGIFNSWLSETSSDNYFIGCMCDGKLSYPDIIEKHLGKIANYQSDSFCAINTAFTKKGAFVYIPKGIKVKKPLQIMWFTTNLEENLLTQPRTLVVAEESSKIQIVERHHSLSKANIFSNAVSEVFCNKNSSVEYYKIQNDNYSAQLIDNTTVVQKRDSVCSVNTFSFGGNFIRNNLKFSFKEENALANLNGITLIEKNQFVDHHTFVDHAVPNCNSNELYKGIFDDNGKGVFNGKVLVRSEAQKTNAFQENKNILLTNNGSIDTKPQLEIFADDVKCSHGCTIGQLDESALFYLRSRGIRKKEAIALLLFAFKNDIIEKVKIPVLKEKLNFLIAKKLNVTLDL